MSSGLSPAPACGGGIDVVSGFTAHEILGGGNSTLKNDNNKKNRFRQTYT